MAAIDRIYVNSWGEYKQFKEWCEVQPSLTDKYGKHVMLTVYLYPYNEEKGGCQSIFCAPYYVDAYLIRNCPFDFIQKELMVNYGHWSQEKINEAFEMVTNRTKENEMFYTWLTTDDFKVVDGVVTMPNLEESHYSQIKRGVLHSSPLTVNEYEVGKHFKCTKHPKYMYNTPFGCKQYFIDVTLPSGMIGYMWYHKEHNTWDFSDEFVDCEWTSSSAFCKSIKALKRLIIKWKFPIGTKVRATARYLFDEYEFVVTK